MMQPPTPRRPRLLWDILGEHLDEAAFLWKQRARALLDLDYCLAELEQGDEARLLAHLDGLAVGGEPVARRLLVPALEDEEDLARIAAAAHALLSSGTRDGLHAVLRRWEAAPSSRPALMRAFELSENTELEGGLLGLLSRAEPGPRAQLLAVLGFRGTAFGTALEQLPLPDEEPALLVATLRASRTASRLWADTLVRRGLEDKRPQVRNAAIEAGLIHGTRAAWVACRRCVEARAPEVRLAMLALSVGGNAADLGLLLEAVNEPALRDEALWALGFSGRLAAAEAALKALRAKGDRLAAGTFASITGLPLHTLPQEEALEPESEEPTEPESMWEEPELFPAPASQKGTVRLEDVEAWWQAQRGRFDSRGRYWYGQPWTPDTLLTALHEAPLRTRPALAWELAIRSRGVCVVETRAWVRTQRQQLHAARKQPLVNMARAFEGFVTS